MCHRATPVLATLAEFDNGNVHGTAYVIALPVEIGIWLDAAEGARRHRAVAAWRDARLRDSSRKPPNQEQYQGHVS